MHKYRKKNGEERNKKASTKESDRGGGQRLISGMSPVPVHPLIWVRG